jgi:formyltetrahydrofolate-dependent phosphoribosylglycinamide formyltransferase
VPVLARRCVWEDSPVSTAGRTRIVVLASGSGTLAQALLDACADPQYPAQVVGVVSDRPEAAVLQRAEAAGVPAVVVPLEQSRLQWDLLLAEECARLNPDWIVSAGFMRILGPSFLVRFPGQVINTHPALLPSFPGAHAVRDALAHGVKITGTTVHVVDTGVDTGPIIAQRAVEVLDGDDEERLHERIKVIERALLIDTVSLLSRSGITISGRTVRAT